MTSALGERLFYAIQTRLTRRSLLIGFGAAGGGVAIASRHLHLSAQPVASVQEALASLATLEALQTTLMGVARDRGDRMNLNSDHVRFLRAAQCEDEAHYNHLIVEGAKATTTRFTLRGRLFGNRTSFFETLAMVKEIAVAAHMVAARELATAGEYRLVEIVYQTGAIESQHLAIARLYAGERLPTDRAFPRRQFGSTAEVIPALIEGGFIDGIGGKYDFPGPVSINCRGVFGLVVETDEDQATPIAATPAAATPVASPVMGSPAASPSPGESATPISGTPTT